MFKRFLFVLLTSVCASWLATAQTADVSELHWVGTWGASPAPQLSDPTQISKAKLMFANQTVREIVHTSVGGSMLRLRISNAYGKQPLEVGSVHVALRAQDAAVVVASDHAVTFGGRSTLSVPPDALVLSDPVPLPLAASADLAVSIFLPKSTPGSGIHYSAQQTNYIGSGDLTGAAGIPQASKMESWVFLTGVDVAAAENAATLVAFGDSITDGALSTVDANHRWPNYLAERILARAGVSPIGVLDAGIGGNRILHDPNSFPGFGVSALARFDRDVLAQPGVKYVIVLEGINDLGHAGPTVFPNEQVSADDIIAGLKQLIARSHEKGIKIYGGTLTPFANTPIRNYFSKEKEVERKAVNDWIRNGRAFDGVLDFEKAVQDPVHPDQMLPQFDSGDHLHPKDAGYKAMADAIDLELFR